MTPVVLRGKLITIRHFEYVSEKSEETKSLSYFCGSHTWLHIASSGEPSKPITLRPQLGSAEPGSRGWDPDIDILKNAPRAANDTATDKIHWSIMCYMIPQK